MNASRANFSPNSFAEGAQRDGRSRTGSIGGVDRSYLNKSIKPGTLRTSNGRSYWFFSFPGSAGGHRYHRQPPPPSLIDHDPRSCTPDGPRGRGRHTDRTKRWSGTAWRRRGTGEEDAGTSVRQGGRARFLKFQIRICVADAEAPLGQCRARGV